MRTCQTCMVVTEAVAAAAGRTVAMADLEVVPAEREASEATKEEWAPHIS